MLVLNENKKHSEQDEHIFLVGVLDRILPNRFHHSPNGGWRHIATAVRLKKMGTSPGFPDIFILGPPRFSDANYHGCVIELKTKNGKTYDAQKAWIEEFRSKGFLGKVCVGAFSALDFLENEGYVHHEALSGVKVVNKEISDEINRSSPEGKLLKSVGKFTRQRSGHSRDRKGYVRIYNRMVREST